jgi:hypothetical protein
VAKTIKIFLRYYLPLLIWAGLIFYFSGIPDLQLNSGIISLEIIIRKFAHLVEYAVLFWLFFRVFFYVHKLDFKYALSWSLFFSVLYAVGDEYHQTFVSGRSGKFIDVIFDSISAFLGWHIISAAINRDWRRKRIFYIVICVLILAIMEFGMIEEGKKENQNINIERSNLAQDQNKNIAENAAIAQTNSADSTAVPEKTDDPIPNKMVIDVPFMSQAPLGNWDQIHEESCEEASLIMLKYYLDGKKLTPDVAEKEIQKMVDFEKKNYGDYRDTTAVENVDLFNAFYGLPQNGLRLKVIYDFSAADIKEYLAKGHPIIISAAGRKLGNPNFTPPGPLYHNLVVVGYDGGTIITNDPGTKRGSGYRYDINTFFNAIHDFPGQPEDILQGRKAMIVLE